MNDYSYKNWNDYQKELGGFPDNQKQHPFKIDNNEQRGIRKSVNYFAKAASIAHGNNPTFVTPQFRQQMTAMNTNTQNAQYDNAKKVQDAQFAQSGMYGQGSHQAANNALASERAKGIADVATKTKTQLDQTEFQNWNDWARQRFAWLNQMDDYANAQKQMEYKRQYAKDQLEQQEKMAKQQMWASILTGGLSALGDMAGAAGDYFSKKPPSK